MDRADEQDALALHLLACGHDVVHTEAGHWRLHELVPVRDRARPEDLENVAVFKVERREVRRLLTSPQAQDVSRESHHFVEAICWTAQPRDAFDSHFSVLPEQLIQPFDRPRPSRRFIDIDDDAVELHRPGGDLEPTRQAVTKASDDDRGIYSEHRVARA